MPDIKLEDKYLDLLTKRWSIYNSIFGLDNFELRIQKRANREGGKKSLEELEQIFPIKGKKLLDVGSCCGEFLFEAVKAGAIGYGIEPDELSLEVSKLLFEINNIEVKLNRAYAEFLPFAPGTFDIVVSIFILEHVKEPEKAILEMVRVLKPGGKLWLRCPNYFYPYERHYKKYYFPLLPKFIEQIYFNIVSGKKTRYFMNLNRITPNFVFKILKKHNLKYQDFSAGKQQKGIMLKLLGRIGLYSEINLLISKGGT
jgi:ubiquinone/menaquinone biosynthesis C-methylase UbiE